MALKVAIQMDPIDAIDIDGDSSFRIAEEAQSRGHSLFFYTPDKLSYREGRVLAKGWPLEVRREKGNHFTLGAETEIDLADWDVVWLRQDPPFDMGYITTTHLLDRIHPGTLVVNDPTWVRNWPEKLKVLDYPDLTPQDLEICARIGQDLKDHGQVFVGIDVIGGWLTEINVTSPTGLQELERFDGVNVTAKLWEAIEGRVARG